jgi:hypothetical protein
MTETDAQGLITELYAIQSATDYRVDWSNMVLDVEPEDRRAVLTIAKASAKDTIAADIDELAATVAGMAVNVEDDATAAEENIAIENA